MCIAREEFLSLAEAIITRAKKDLISKDDYLAIQAAKYFFLEPTQNDESDLMRFAGFCNATGINADAAAQAIFNELLPHQQKRIRSLLRNAEYHTQPKISIPVG